LYAIQTVPTGEVPNYLADAYLKRGICWHYQGQDTLARGDFEQAASINYDDPLAYFWLGITYAQEGDFREAIRHYSDAIAKNPKFTLALVNRGLAYLQLKLPEKAVENFQKAVELAVAERRKSVDEAVQTFRQEAKEAISGRKSSIDKLVSELKDAEKAATEKAKSACEDGSDPKETMESFKEDLKVAREEFKSDREKIEKVGETVRESAKVKNQAIWEAVEDFKSAIEKARENLKAAFE
jgi:tetratricopeptide (TPR) repeat protein